MKIEDRVLYADVGKKLTNGNTYGIIVYLSDNDKIENWYEITDEEYQTILAQQEEELNKTLI